MHVYISLDYENSKISQATLYLFIPLLIIGQSLLLMSRHNLHMRCLDGVPRIHENEVDFSFRSFVHLVR